MLLADVKSRVDLDGLAKIVQEKIAPTVDAAVQTGGGIRDAGDHREGGDGSPGVGIMHIDFEGSTSARMRNPMIISAERPGIVEFRTSNLMTTGHWW
ncbi:MAG: hypothetical protein IH920_05610 [Chloroflexi bacterium]|nr:hypothetical protein [Chloroflexota bacterium]